MTASRNDQNPLKKTLAETEPSTHDNAISSDCLFKFNSNTWEPFFLRVRAILRQGIV